MSVKMGRLIGLLLITLYIQGCSGKRVDVENYGFVTHRYIGLSFDMMYASGQNMPKQVDVLRVYIEGDGFAWINKYTPSSDPTPRRSVMLNLMQVDTSPNTLYLGRPCQYVMSVRCNNKYWMGSRYSKEIASEMNRALDELKKLHKVRRFELIGHSGGGAMAVLLASMRDDVSKIITVAGNLDVETFTNIHRTTPLYDSLNPFDVKEKVADIPQLHLYGERDKVVSKAVIDSFVRKQPSNCVKKMKMAGATHMEGWAEQWQKIVNVPLTCN